VPALKTGALRTVSCDGEHDNEVVAVLPSQVDGVAVDKSPRDRCLTEAGQKWRRGDLEIFAVASASSVACVVFRSDHTPLKQRLIG
jgi:ABC-type phosphate/phosphonate transport system substrate-binding protein